MYICVERLWNRLIVRPVTTERIAIPLADSAGLTRTFASITMLFEHLRAAMRKTELKHCCVSNLRWPA